MRPNSKCVTVGLMEKDLLHKLIKAARKTTCHCNVSEDDIPLQCRGRRHVIAMSRKKTCPRISCGKRHVSATSRKTPCHWNVYRKTTCHCNVSKDEMPLQCLSEDDMPLQCLPDKSDGCLPLPHHVLSSAVAISAKLKIIFLPTKVDFKIPARMHL